MIQLYKDYFWKNGRPSGKFLANPEDKIAFKIVSDPYFKHISIEVYQEGNFLTAIYDTRLLDFRLLRQELPPSWQKKQEKNPDGTSRALIYDHDDRLAWIETYIFEQELCKVCFVHAPQGLLLSTHQIHYSKLGHSFDGIELFDSWGKIVMRKRYAITSEGEFDQLLEENWYVEAEI